MANKNLNLNLQLGLDKLKEAKNKRYGNEKMTEAGHAVAATLQSKTLHSQAESPASPEAARQRSSVMMQQAYASTNIDLKKISNGFESEKRTTGLDGKS